MTQYYLYTHTRLDTGIIFYVGIGKTHKEDYYERAYKKSSRSREWQRVFEECGRKYKVVIAEIFLNKEECVEAEMVWIKRLGRKCKDEGDLANKAPGGYYWKDGKPVYQYDSISGKFIKEWGSAREAAEFLNVLPQEVYKSCESNSNRKVQSALFRDFKKDYINPWTNQKAVNRYKPIYIFTSTCDFIVEVNSTEKAADYLSAKEKSVMDMLSGRTWYVADHIVSYKKEECPCKRIIYQYNSVGKLVGKYPSLPQAAAALGVKSINSIDNAIKGLVQKTAYGFKWESKENIIVNAG